MYASDPSKKFRTKPTQTNCVEVYARREGVREATTMDTETHTAHPDTILLRNRKRGWAGGSAAVPDKGGRVHQPATHTPPATQRKHISVTLRST